MPRSRSGLLESCEGNEQIWEYFHDNSKTEYYDRAPDDEMVRRRMAELWTSLPYDGYPSIDLPYPPLLEEPLGLAMRRRVTGRDLRSCALTLLQLSALLEYSYGETRDDAGTGFPRPFRAIPSGGALYPLEVYVHSAHLTGASAGLYHYNPANRKIRLLRAGDHTCKLCNCFVQRDMPVNSAAQIFITAFFERSIFKYGARGYRFVFLEAGHLAQNMNLVATALGLGIVNIGGFFDREMDDFLEMDGVTRSTIYVLAIGQNGGRESEVVGGA